MPTLAFYRAADCHVCLHGRLYGASNHNGQMAALWSADISLNRQDGRRLLNQREQEMVLGSGSALGKHIASGKLVELFEGGGRIGLSLYPSWSL